MSPADRVLARWQRERPPLVSTDVFDTILLRDGSTEDERFRQAAVRAADVLGLRARAVHLARRELHDAGYRAVEVERPHGEARLADMAVAMTRLLGAPEAAADVIVRVEVETDAEHLAGHHDLIRALEVIAASGSRVIGVSDTWYSERDVQQLLDAVVGRHPLRALYVSSEVGLTKHDGGLYSEVARRERVAGAGVLHLGDNVDVDVVRAREAGWTAEHLPRRRRHRADKVVGGLRGLTGGWLR